MMMTKLQIVLALLSLLTTASSFTLQSPPVKPPSAAHDESTQQRQRRRVEDVTSTAPPAVDQPPFDASTIDFQDFPTMSNSMEVTPFPTPAPTATEDDQHDDDATPTYRPTTTWYPTLAPALIKNQDDSSNTYRPTATWYPTLTGTPSNTGNPTQTWHPTVTWYPTSTPGPSAENSTSTQPANETIDTPYPTSTATTSNAPSSSISQDQQQSPTYQPTTTWYPTQSPQTKQSSEAPPNTVNPYEDTGYHAPKLASPSDNGANDTAPLSNGGSKFGVAIVVLLVTGMAVTFLVRRQRQYGGMSILTRHGDLDLQEMTVHHRGNNKRRGKSSSPTGFRDASDPLSMDIRGPDREFI